MRLAPIAIRFHSQNSAANRARLQSEVTHALPVCMDACAWFAELLHLAIFGATKAEVLAPATLAAAPEIAAIGAGSWRGKSEAQIRSTGYVVHTLEAALWCVDQSDTFAEAVLRAANLGHDADTVAAVTGQLAGALWGLAGIPAHWQAQLAWRDDIVARATLLWDTGAASPR